MSEGAAESSDAFDNVIGGGLRLKGVKLKKKKKKSKKSKSKKRHRDDIVESPRERVREKRPSDVPGEIRKEVVDEELDEDLTATERKFIAMRKRREAQIVGKMVEKTHRERIDAFNNHLASLSEHHDIPKVGNAGMG